MKNKINLIFFTLFFLKNDLKSSNNNNGIRKSSSLGSLNGRCNISIEQIQPKNPFNNQLSQESNYNNNDIMGIINGTGSSENYMPNHNAQNSQEIENSNFSNNMQESNLSSMEESNLSYNSKIYRINYLNKRIERNDEKLEQKDNELEEKNLKIIELEKKLEKEKKNQQCLLNIMQKYSGYIPCMDEKDSDILGEIFKDEGFEYNNQKRQLIGKSVLPEFNEELNGNSSDDEKNLFENNGKIKYSFTIENFPLKKSLENMQNESPENGLLGINPTGNNNNENNNDRIIRIIDNNNNDAIRNDDASLITKIRRYLNI